MDFEKEVREIEKIARIKLSEEERKQFAKEFKEVLENFEKIKEVDTENIEICLHPIRIENVFREDKEEKKVGDFLANTINKENNFFKGPKII